MQIFEDGGMSVQTFGAYYTVWCCTGGRLIEVAQFVSLDDASVYVDSIAQERRSFGEVYTILSISPLTDEE